METDTFQTCSYWEPAQAWDGSHSSDTQRGCICLAASSEKRHFLVHWWVKPMAFQVLLSLWQFVQVGKRILCYIPVLKRPFYAPVPNLSTIKKSGAWAPSHRGCLETSLGKYKPLHDSLTQSGSIFSFPACWSGSILKEQVHPPEQQLGF